ncbi:type II secretion system major pseudopilin GspG [Cupriavidus sp. CV2]|uniref:type II secretion system major pseudopilin GspG n=1 Tax=Cupriavidus ulmosensis TaxID=3065913 RepID=UPI00296B3A20|nr:type II secretion system major pseudopilin GspG [Cupriavidus sp. CV2]MDW3685651.1 type II secretion system major pseudopilin GspG [Cupriavidus sp. CV2]
MRIDTQLNRLCRRTCGRIGRRVHGRLSGPSGGRCIGTDRGRTNGFTLLELLVVLVIIGLLAGLVAPKYFAQLGKSNISIAKAQISSLGKALDQYRLDVGSYPTTEERLDALVAKPQSEPRWSGPYLEKAVPMDPWGRPYQYRSPGEHGDYDLVSFGKDGQAGGDGENADVTSW